MEKRHSDGKFKKGVVQDGAGRPKGSVSEKTRIWNEIGEWFKGEGLEAYKANLMEMMADNKQKAEAMKRYETLLEYFAPKLSRVESKNETKVNLEKPIKWLDEK